MPWELVERMHSDSHPYEVFQVRAMLAVPYFEKALYEMEDEEVGGVADGGEAGRGLPGRARESMAWCGLRACSLQAALLRSGPRHHCSQLPAVTQLRHAPAAPPPQR
jgi:hypothetical protein